MSDQPGFRQPDPQDPPAYPGPADPYAQPHDQAGQTERMPTYPPSGSAPYGQPPYGDPAQPSYGAEYGQSSYGQPTPQPYGVAPYSQQPAYGYGVAEHPQATTILVLGILGFFVPIVPFVAWYMGGQIKREIDSGAPYQWEGSLKIGYLLGKILGIIQIASVVLTVVALIFMVVVLASTGY